MVVRFLFLMMKAKHILYLSSLAAMLLLGHLESSPYFGQELKEGEVILEMAEPHAAADSLTAHIQHMNDQAVCTLYGLEKMFEEYVWMDEDSSFEARIAAWNAHGDFCKWMGRLEPETGKTILLGFKDQLHQMILRMEQGEITYSVKSAWINYCKFSPTNAFVRSGANARTIFLCPKWFEQPETQQVATLIHEVVHTFGFSHPNDTDTPLEAVALAKEDPQLAIQSPENFESLVELYVCR